MYTPTTWTAGTTPLSATNLNHIEQEYTQAVTSFNQDLFSSYVLYGMICTADLSTLNQLDVTAGVSYIVQTDGTLYRIPTIASIANQFLTTTINTTYFLDLTAAGTFNFATSHPGGTYLTICSCTTNVSGNISGVTDTRNLYASVIPTSTGAFAFGVPTTGGRSIDVLGTDVSVAVVAPTAPTATPVAGSGLSVGVYGYKVTYGSFSGESALSAAGTCTTTAPNSKVNLTVIPTGPTGTIRRKVYRTKVGGSSYFLLTTITDNTTTTYADTTADASLVSAAPVHPTMGSSLWKSNGGTTLGAIYGDGSFAVDSGNISSDGAGDLTVGGTVNFTTGGSNPPAFLQWSSGNVALAINAPLTGFGANDGIYFACINGGSVMIPFSIGGQFAAATSWINANGSIGQINGQPTAGSFGVPVIVAQTIRQHITVTTQVQVISYSVTATGVYRISGYFYLNNGTSSQAILFSATSTDPDSNAGNGMYFVTEAGALTILHNTAIINGQYPCFPQLITAKTGTTINVNYQDPANTPNDFVSAIIERMA